MKSHLTPLCFISYLVRVRANNSQTRSVHAHSKKENERLEDKIVISYVATRGYCRSTHLFGQTHIVHRGEADLSERGGSLPSVRKDALLYTGYK